MSTNNNNQAVVKELAEGYYRQNRQQNKIFITAAAMAVFLLYSAFSIAYGKIRSDYLIDLRGMGTAATVSLENGSKAQYEQMESLSYIEDVGIKKSVGTAAYGKLWEGSLVFLDRAAYEKMMKPAYTDVVGEYPENHDEIMLSAESLQQMGIGEPELGMKLEFSVTLADGSEETISFFLSGFYTDYMDHSVTEAEAYAAGSFLEQRDISVFPADKIMAVSDVLPGGSIENRLYADLAMEYETQQVFGENPMVRQSIEGVFGSIFIAIGCGLMVMLCAFMLVFNVISITTGRDIRQYGMLKVLGTTNQQLKGIVNRQNIRNIGTGILIGSLLSTAAVKLFLPAVLKRLFMRGLGDSDVTGFYPWLLCGAVLLVSGTSFCAAGLAVRQVMKWNAIDSIRYIDKDHGCQKVRRNTAGRFILPGLAWRNICRSKKRLFISVLSLAIGCIMALVAAVIMTGTDITNQIKKNPDFRIGILAGISRFPEMVPGKTDDNTPVLPPEMVNVIYNMDGIEKETLSLTSGSYAVIDFDRDTSLQPRRKSLEDPGRKLDFATLQIVDESFVDELENYVDDGDLPVEIDSFKAGEACILLHHNELSRELEDQAAKVTGKPIHFYSLNAYGSAEDAAAGHEKGSLNCAGYLDMTEKYFPSLQTTSLGNNINYFIMTEKGFSRLGFPEKIFDISFNASKREKVAVYQKLSQLVQKENKDSGIMDTFYLADNQTLLEAEQNRITAANIILGGLSAVILVIGIVNYGNTLSATLSVRRKELAIMQSLGLTKNQLWKMVFFEGTEYWLLVMSVAGIMGSCIIWILGAAIKKKLLYFRFVYPWQILLLLGVLLIGVTLITTGVFYCKGKNFTEELRRNND